MAWVSQPADRDRLGPSKPGQVSFGESPLSSPSPDAEEAIGIVDWIAAESLPPAPG